MKSPKEESAEEQQPEKQSDESSATISEREDVILPHKRAYTMGEEFAVKGEKYARSISKQASKAVRTGKKQADQALDRLRDMAKKKPLTLLAGAAAVGAFAALLFPRNRR